MTTNSLNDHQVNTDNHQMFGHERIIFADVTNKTSFERYLSKKVSNI